MIGQQGAIIARAKPLVAKGAMIQCRQFGYEHVLLVERFFDRVKQVFVVNLSLGCATSD